MCYNGLPDRAKELFFDNNVKTVGSWIPHSSPGQIWDKDGYFSFANNARDNSRLFYIASMHMICHSLSTATWFEDDFKKRIWDQGKIKDFFNLIGATKDFDTYANKYGNQNTAAQERASLHSQYEDALRRCYDSAYIIWQNGWQTVIQNPSTSFDLIETTLKSDQYKEHWLPTLVNPEYDGPLPVRTQLAIMQDKLNLLATVKAKNDGTSPDLQRVTNLINELIACTKATGLVGESFITPDHEVCYNQIIRRSSNVWVLTIALSDSDIPGQLSLRYGQ